MTPKKLRRIYEQDDDENKTPKEIADEGIEILFEDDEVLFLRIYKRVSMEYYAPEEISRQFQHNDKKNYLVLSKGDKLSFWLQEPRYGAVYIEGFDGKVYLFDTIINLYPQITKEIIELTKSDDTPYGMLKMIKLGKQYDKYDLKYNTNKFISDIHYNTKNPGKSQIELDFTYEEYLSMFQFEYREDRNIAIDIINGYSHTFYHPNDDEWTEGYIMREFNHTNMELVKKILKYTYPASLRIKDDEKFYKEVSKFLYETFYYKIDGIIEHDAELRNEAYSKKLKQEIISDFADILSQYKIYRIAQPFDLYVTNVNDLLSLYEKVDDKTIPLIHSNTQKKTLFRTIGKNFGIFGEYGTDDLYGIALDDEKFNEYVTSQLEEILEEIDENPEKYINKISEIYDELNKLGYDLDTNYPLPTDNSKSFKIIDIDKDTLRITLYHFDKGTEKRSYSIDEFKNYISTGELFERLIRKLKKLL